MMNMFLGVTIPTISFSNYVTKQACQNMARINRRFTGLLGQEKLFINELFYDTYRHAI